MAQAFPSSRLIFLLLGRDLRHALDAAALAAALLGEHVVAGGLAVQHLALARHAESLGGGAVGLHLRHRIYPSFSGAVDLDGLRVLDRSVRRRRPAHRPPRSPRAGTRSRRPASTGRSASAAAAAPALACASTYFLLGAITMIMLRPSCFGIDSTTIDVAEVLDHPVQDLATEVRVRHLAPAEHDRDLDLVPALQEPLDVALLRGVVVRGRSWGGT